MATIILPTHTMECGCKYKGLANQYDYCPAHSRIIKKGDERARFGQRNRIESSTPFTVHKEQIPKHPQSKQVYQILLEIRASMGQLMGDPEEWHRMAEIEALAKQQLRDEVGSIFEKVGRQTVETFWEDGDELWPARTAAQEQIAAAFEFFVSKLTEVQQETIRLRYWRRLSQKETGENLGVSKKSVEVNEQRARTALVRHFLEEWPAEEKELVNAV